ncbi:hypothetical protein CB1_000539002 [Camelus ferus]|nr:hypothetical protein CB1_000539002 [Camelus ferus]
MVSNGHALLRQACGICAITMSLVACVINSLVNICLIGTQNLFSLVLALCVLVNLTGLALLACVLAVTVIVLHPDLTLRLATQVLSQLHAQPSYHRLGEDVVWLSHLALGLEA